MNSAVDSAVRRRRANASAATGAGAASAASAPRPDAAIRAREGKRVIPPGTSPDRALAGIDALAFATDPSSELALREGLAGCRDGQVWPGGLRMAVTALGQGHAPRLLFVDLDGTAYPGGAIHELAAVCEVGTVVIALGSDDSARSSREILLAGVSDYLVKPITAATVREAAVRGAGSAENRTGEGWLVGFAGPGGSGATTLAAATALVAAERGRYVSVLDLNRTFSALSFQLDVEPASGLVDLLSAVARASLHPEMVDGIRAVRSDRISVYGYPWSAEPPPLAPVWAVCELLVELQRRSHLVILDGMDDPATRQTLLAMVDARVLVIEPTLTGAAAAARMMARLGPMLDLDWPFVLVQNHTREIRTKAGTRAFETAGVTAAPDVVVPFEPAVPSVADRGWPQGRLPRTLREPLEQLTDRILASARVEPIAAASREPAGVGADSRASQAPAGRSRTASEPSGRSRRSALRSVLSRLLPDRGPRPRAA